MKGVRGSEILHGVGGTTVGLVIVGTLGLVKGLLGSALAVITLDTASDTVSGVGDSLLDLVLGGLHGVGGGLLLGLCDDSQYQQHDQNRQTASHILVVKSLRPASDMMVD